MNRSTSLYLDLIRPVMAVLVLLSHVSYANLTAGQLAWFAPFGTQAVDVFFVLSGFVIAFVCATRERDAQTYTVNRVVRIGSVAAPALLLTMVLDTIGHHVDPATYPPGLDQGFGAGPVLRSITFLGEQWSTHRFPGSDGPWWSLGFEVWYYVAYGLFVFTPRRWRWPAMLAALAFVGPKVAILFPLWLLGIVAYRLCTAYQPPRSLGWTLFLAPPVLFALFQLVPGQASQPFINLSLQPDRLFGLMQDYVVGVLFTAHLIGVSTLAPVFGPFLDRHARAIRWVAGATFSLYLTHLPVMYLLSALSPAPKSSPATLLLLLLVTPAVCLAFAELFERRKAFWRNLLLSGTRRMQVPGAARHDRRAAARATPNRF